MKTSVIIAVYDDVVALRLIINSLLAQTKLPDEIIIAEDGENIKIKQYIDSTANDTIKHVFHKDDGWQKEKILNKAIKKSSGDYLILIDGDCVPYDTFVQAHIELSKPKTALCGRRTEPGYEFSKMLRDGMLSISAFKKQYLLNYFKLKKDNIRHFDEGIYLHQKSLLFKLLHMFSRKNSHIVGCNWSCFKKDLAMINGYDEDFTLPTTGEDSDIERRLSHFRVKMVSCRNAAILVHLFHKKIFNPDISSQTRALMHTKENIFVCKNGIKKYIHENHISN